MKTRRAALIAATLMSIGMATPALADPPPWAPAHGHRAKQAAEYRYVYYPAQQVYYAPQEQIWFWMNGGSWNFGVNLPAQFRISASSGVPVVLGTSKPYIEHGYVEEHYGRPWREKHKKEKHHKHG